MTSTPQIHFLLVDAAQLALSHQRVREADPRLAPAAETLAAAADLALSTPRLSVTQKQRLAPSGNPHDYLSMGPYWWPNPETPDGLPYIRRDGEKNPETGEYDAPRLKRLVSAVVTLAWAGYFLDRPACSERAADLARAWFLEEDTRMTPHLDYGQFIPGVCDGRGIGIIDTSTVFQELLDALLVLGDCGALAAGDWHGLQAWMTAYRDWTLSSANGRDEAGWHNNHGTWYDVQLAALALFTGEPELAARVCREACERRIAAQIEPDGRQPHELARTRSFSYSLMNLEGLFNLASLGRRVNVDLFGYETGDGRGIRQALDWLRPFAANPRTWTEPQITPVDPGDIVALYHRAAQVYPDAGYGEVLEAWPGESQAHIAQLLWPR